MEDKERLMEVSIYLMTMLHVLFDFITATSIILLLGLDAIHKMLLFYAFYKCYRLTQLYMVLF